MILHKLCKYLKGEFYCIYSDLNNRIAVVFDAFLAHFALVDLSNTATLALV